VHVASCIGLQKAIQHHLMQGRGHVCPVYERTILCWIERPQLLVLQLQACMSQAAAAPQSSVTSRPARPVSATSATATGHS
jgi:hypothetical protein